MTHDQRCTHFIMGYSRTTGPRLTLKVWIFTLWGHSHRVAQDGRLPPEGVGANSQLRLVCVLVVGVGVGVCEGAVCEAANEGKRSKTDCAVQHTAGTSTPRHPPAADWSDHSRVLALAAVLHQELAAAVVAAAVSGQGALAHGSRGGLGGGDGAGGTGGAHGGGAGGQSAGGGAGGEGTGSSGGNCGDGGDGGAHQWGAAGGHILIHVRLGLGGCGEGAWRWGGKGLRL